MKRKEPESKDWLLGSIVIIGALGIGVFTFFFGMETTPSNTIRQPYEHRTDTVSTLPVIEFDSVSTDRMDDIDSIN